MESFFPDYEDLRFWDFQIGLLITTDIILSRTAQDVQL